MTFEPRDSSSDRYLTPKFQWLQGSLWLLVPSCKAVIFHTNWCLVKSHPASVHASLWARAYESMCTIGWGGDWITLPPLCRVCLPVIAATLIKLSHGLRLGFWMKQRETGGRLSQLIVWNQPISVNPYTSCPTPTLKKKAFFPKTGAFQKQPSLLCTNSTDRCILLWKSIWLALTALISFCCFSLTLKCFRSLKMINITKR